MAEYRRLRGGVDFTVAADTTQRNPGKYTGQIDTSSFSNLAQIECYHMSVDGPVGFGLTVWINAKRWGGTAQGWQNEWDPAEPMLLNPSDVIYLFFQAPVPSVPVPSGTAWFRYDLLLPGNQSRGGG